MLTVYHALHPHATPIVKPTRVYEQPVVDPQLVQT
jgi:hypothetical protein